MIRQSLLYRILSAIHIVFFSSILCFGTICLSGTLLFMPVLGACFHLGRDVIYREFDIHDSIIKTYFKYLKSSIQLVKYFGINLIIALNIVGMMLTAKTSNFIYSVVCLAIIGFLLSFSLYITGYNTFISPRINLTEVAISMFIKPQLLLPVFIVMVICVLFFSGILFTALLFLGTLILFVLEILIFIQMLQFKKITGKLSDSEKYAYLVN